MRTFGTTIQNVVNYIRANEAAVLNGIDPNGQHTIELVYTPTNHTQLLTTIATLNSIQNDNIVAAVGDFASSASTSGQLSDKSLYSYFFRTIADDPSQGIVIAQYLRYMGWKSAALVTSNDAYGQSGFGTFLTTAQSLGITIKANQAFNPGQADFSFLLDAIVASGSHIIVIASTASASLPFVRAANARGLIGPQWVWVAPEAHQDMANGMIYVYPQAKSFNAAFNASLARYNQAYPNAPASNYGFMFLDCLTALARGVIRLAQDVSPADILSRNYRPNMTRYFLEPFDGVTGRIEYDRNGNRIAAFSVYNWYNGTSSLVYDVLPDKTVVPRGPVRFNDGTSNVPRDSTYQEPLVPYWSSPSGIALTVLNVIILAAIAVAWVVFNIAALGDPTNVGCQASLWLFTYGFELVMASSAAKAYRLWRIFDNRYISAGKIGNKYLFAGVAVIMLIQTVILAVWNGVGAQQAILVSRRTYFFFRCASIDANFNMALSAVTIAYNALLLLALLFLAYKTRNIAMNFNETSFLFYTAQNTFLSGAVVAAFAFFDFGESHLSGLIVKQVVIIYSVTFAFTALSKAPLDPNASKSGRNAFSSSVTNTTGRIGSTTPSAGQGQDLKTTPFVQETLACKKLGSLMSTWINHNVMLFTNVGYLTLVNTKEEGQAGTVIQLTKLQYDASESFANCIEIWAKGKGWALQFETADQRETWLKLLGASNATKKSSATSSTGGAATSNHRKSTTGA
ncbi:periplasmic binding protein-like I [Catenaria anguillulae PL171]|uniref:Periplasmic binding protein-like I n=1 Tax=Catenaria anguillulae PL171 TaxID=765915 RepID=A0A1Y2HDJ0_9FUNG|nr:periplasmic binding protein-like I [Catenaria anguillulae PL171]